jgi:hypothetical protein
VPRLHIERVLLVAGGPDTGKSTQLRSVFLDPRFGTTGEIPTTRKVAETYSISPGRRLYLRLTSPHEAGESLNQFIDKIVLKTGSGRWCVASAVQIDAANNMPALPDTVDGLLRRLSPERVRVAVLSPDRHSTSLAATAQLFDSLWVRRCDAFCIGARNRVANGLLLADTFDFA